MSLENADIPAIQQAIRDKLDALVDDEVLGGVLEDEFRLDILTADIPKTPCAILQPPSMDSNFDTSHENVRTITFDIMVVMRGENISEKGYVGKVMQGVVNKFDIDPTLVDKSGAATVVKSWPGTSPVASVNAGDKTLVLFVVTIKCETYYQYR